MATTQVSAQSALATPVSDVSQHLRCSACEKPVFNAFQTPHGCRLCNSCVNGLPETDKVACPGKSDACKDPEEEIDINKSSCYPDIATRREIGRLQVFCPNKPDGCRWQSKWKDVDTHLESCEFQKVSCDQCNELVMQKKLKNHRERECPQRRVKCDMCGQSVVFSDMSRTHKNLESSTCCPKFKASCPYCKDKSRDMDRNAFIQHIPQCPEKPQACSYEHLGCTFRSKKSELQAHYKNEAHEHLRLLDEMVKKQAQNRPPAVQPVQQTASSVEPSGSQKEVEKKFLNMYDMFKKLQVNVANWAHTSIELEQMMDKFGGINQMQGFLKNLEEKLHQGNQSSSEGYGSRSGPSTDSSMLSDIQQKVDALEKRVFQLEATSYDGKFTWKIKEWGAQRQKKDIKSPEFYSHRFGYKFRLVLFPSGINGSSHPTLQLLNEQHEFDDTLDWPVKFKVDLVLICVSNKAKNVSKTQTIDCQMPRGGEPCVCLTEEKLTKRLDQDGFAKKDAIYITCGVTSVTGSEKQKK